ncbi:response regulator [Campylobacter sp. W0065]|uniref:response regulator n=1 Tax=Campylobacter molothri TaxID=1032242 RepID=UPI00301D27A2|nr:response regulator [Campylobacter sp. W0065]
MKVLIIENEIYLAQSIGIKLNNIGYDCTIINSFDEYNEEKRYDIILLSANTSNFLKAVEYFKNNIIILLISYISTDVVSTPLKMGASDYIQKPFMIEELIRKIKHHQDFRKLLAANKTYESYIKSRIKMIKIPEYNYKKIKLPLILKSNLQNSADAFVFKYLYEHNMTFAYIDLAATNAIEKVMKFHFENTLLFLNNLQILKTSEKEILLNFVKNKPVILHTNSQIENTKFNQIDLNDDQKGIISDEILTIDEYIRYIVLNYQNVLSDTDLSKKIGISRKSLWQKRKKYDLKKK